MRLRIDEVLYYRWDPIGVAGSPAARGEYSSYVEALLPLVIAGEERAIAHHLSEIERNAMGMDGNPEHNLQVAKYLVGVKEAVEKGWR